VFDGIRNAAIDDRYAWFADFYDNFFNTDKFLGNRLSEEALRNAPHGMLWTHATSINEILLRFLAK
jgi:hypothetical protein